MSTIIYFSKNRDTGIEKIINKEDVRKVAMDDRCNVSYVLTVIANDMVYHSSINDYYIKYYDDNEITPLKHDRDFI